MRLRWAQSEFAWIAADPRYADKESLPVKRRVKPSVRRLSARLLTFGGTHVCIPFPATGQTTLILRAGQLVRRKSIQLKPGRRGECHANSAKLWKRNQSKYRLLTGYALADDKMWRRHSWLLTNQGQIVETTFMFKKYFGVELEGEEAEAFYEYWCDS
jgi:hypothetical protein